MPATMTLFKAFNDLARPRPTRPLVFANGADRVVQHALQ